MIGGFRILAICTARVHETYTISFIKELNRLLSGKGWRIFVCTVCSDLSNKTRSDAGEASVFELIDYERTDAIILFPNSIQDQSVNDGIVSKAKAAGVRVFLVDGDDAGCINMKFDYRNGFKAIVRHLFDDHGVRDIHMIAGVRDRPESEIRIDAVRELAAERGLAFDESHISYGDFWSVPTIRACEQLLKREKLPEALICANDAMAIAACGVFRRNGVRIPEDMLITGFDGIEETKYTYPKISTVKCDFNILAVKTASVLTETDMKSGDVFITPVMTVSESCGCGSSKRFDISEVLTSYRYTFDRYRDNERKLNFMSSKVQGCEDLDSLERELTGDVFTDMLCVLKKECTDPTYDPLTVNTPTPFGKDMVVVSDTRGSYIGKERGYDIAETVPGLDELLERKVPLFFTALHYIDIPLGYLCFFHSDNNRDEQLKISQTTGYISSAVGGYRNMRYQNKLREWIEEVYKYDELTGLYTRKSFCREYERMLAEDGCTEMTFVLCDLDGLKYINDNFGHSEGDMAIRVVAKALELACVGGICSKYGGDEILAAIPKLCDPEKIKADVERFIDDYNEASMKPYSVSASIGICTANDGDLSFLKLFAEADDIMYMDKMRKKSTREAELIFRHDAE